MPLAVKLAVPAEMKSRIHIQELELRAIKTPERIDASVSPTGAVVGVEAVRDAVNRPGGGWDTMSTAP